MFLIRCRQNPGRGAGGTPKGGATKGAGASGGTGSGATSGTEQATAHAALSFGRTARRKCQGEHSSKG